MVNHGDSRGTCVKVSLGTIARNTRLLKEKVGENVRMLAVVKANAYGHGAVQVAKTALENGASFLAVALPEEGRQLRENGIEAPVIVLGNTTEAGAEISVQNHLVQTAFDENGIMRLQRACDKLHQTAEIHLKLDTGMSRIGARNEKEVNAFLEALKKAPDVHLTGAFTHFADADNPDDDFSRQQFEKFEKLTALLPEGLLLHAAASDASLRFPFARLNMVREGISLYGCPNVATDLPLKPAMRFETRVAYVKEIEAGDTVSYGRTFKAEHPMRVATLPVGYGDGYPRAVSGKASVLIGGMLCPVLGRVCMDQMMVDVTPLPEVREGDEAVLMGTQNGVSITPNMLAEWAGTITYEIMLSPHGRVPVVYED